MSAISIDLSYVHPFVQADELAALEPQVKAAVSVLEGRKGPGHEFLGWLDLPVKYDRAEFKRIKAAAKRIQRQSEILVVIGIGGSYLGAKAALEFCRPTPPLFPAGRPKKSALQVCFAGTNLSGPYLSQLLDTLGDRPYSINVISKSGTTTEPAIAFRILKEKLERQFGKDGARERIYATTDRAKGALKSMAEAEGYETFTVPDDVGGRFSVLTAVGLLPIAAAGIAIDQLLKGAADARSLYRNASLAQNELWQYVAVRNILYRKGKAIELLVNYEPRLHYLAEWWKQLFGESEGKDGKGIFTASADFTADLHSLGQYIQDGRRHLFETLLEIQIPEADLQIPSEPENRDGLNYLAGKTLDYVNKKAAEGTLMAHRDGGVPSIQIRIPEATPYYLGQLFYFFEKACAVSGYLLGVNPFDQPGVEAYKQNMFRLLGKP